MPCYDDRSNDSQRRHGEHLEQKIYEKLSYENNITYINHILILLCSACSSLERLQYNFKENPLLDKWYDSHKKLDELNNRK